MMNTQRPASEPGVDVAPDTTAGPVPMPTVDTLAALVAAREARGLSSADVAGMLKLAGRQVTALEQGDWAALPGPAFVRGVLRAYGRLLGVGIDGLLATFDDSARAAELRPTPSLGTPMPSGSMLGFGGGGRGSKTAWLILGAILILVLALFFGRDTDFSTIPSLLPRSLAPAEPVAGVDAAAARPNVEQIPTLAQSRPAVSSPASDSPATPALAAEPVTVSSPSPTSASAKAPGSATTPQPAPPVALISATPPAAAGTPLPAPGGPSVSVRLQFDRQSWVDIKDADGRVLLSGVQLAGTEARLPLVAEMSLLIGNAEHVRVEHNGRPLDIKPQIRQGVARLKLNP